MLVNPVWAGNPISVYEGQMDRYDLNKGPIQYKTDLGTLGILSNEAATALVQEAFQIWQDVPQAAISFERTGFLESDINVETYIEFSIDQYQLCTFNPRSNSYVVFDDGRITETLFGEGAYLDVYGFGGPNCIFFPNEISTGALVLNGVLAQDPRFKAAVVHLVGHFIGLDHTLLSSTSELELTQLPTMFEFIFDVTQETPEADDRAWLGYLYPEASVTTDTGMITGQVLLNDGVTGFQGANVIARRVGDPLIEAISNVSGFLNNPEASVPHLVGYFSLPGLPPGEYTLAIQPINPERMATVGFLGTEEVPIPVFPPGGVAEFYNSSESATDNPTTSTSLTVTAGSVLEGINIILNAPPGPQVTVTTSEPNPSLALGQSVDLILTLETTDVLESLTLAALGLPRGVTASFTPTIEDPNTIVLRLVATNDAITGGATVVVSPQLASGDIVPAILNLTIVPPTTVTPLEATFTKSGQIPVQRIRQELVVLNSEDTSLTGPLYAALEGLTAGASLTSAQAGTSATDAPLSIVLGTLNTLPPSAQITTRLEFDNPTPSILSYTPQLRTASGQAVSSQITVGGQIQVTRTRQQVTVRNAGTTTLTGPLFLATEALPNGITLINRTTLAPDTGSPMIGLTLDQLGPGAQFDVVLDFDNPTVSALEFTPRLLRAN